MARLPWLIRIRFWDPGNISEIFVFYYEIVGESNEYIPHTISV